MKKVKVVLFFMLLIAMSLFLSNTNVSAATCIGSCGTLGANGVVTAPPGGGDYDWVSTSGGTSGTHLGIGGTNGSLFRTDTFAVNAGALLEFDFNYVTSDGAGFADYGWARLLDSSMTEVAVLFTARTTPGGNTVPGFGLPPIAATISPVVVTITAGGPSWSPLGGYSGSCYSTGCGYTGWVASDYTIASAGSYVLEFGAANWLDTIYYSGLAYSGIAIDGTPIGVPEPGTMILIGSGLIGLAYTRRRMKR